MRRSVAIAALAPLPALVARADTPSAPEWALGASIAGYVLPDAPDYLQPTATADRGWLHLEGRYHYEGGDTGSVFVGWNGGLGEALRLEFTPMLGGVFGSTNGVAPGLRVDLAWGPFALHSESEYVFDVGELTASFFYEWSEVGARLGDHLRAGLAAQRTKVFATPRALSIGPWLAASLWKLDAAVYLFDPFDGRYLVASAAITF